MSLDFQKKKRASREEATDQAKHPPHEFGGPVGAALGLLGLPMVIYYLWLSIEFNHGSLLSPWDFLDEPVWTFLLARGTPTLFSVGVYLSWVTLQVLLAVYGSGPIGEGALLTDGKTRLKYRDPFYPSRKNS